MINKYFNQLYIDADSENIKNICKAIKVTGPHDVILDVGCWDGTNTLKWVESANANKVYGIEPTHKAALVAKGKNIHVFEKFADKNKWPLKNMSLDCVITNQVVEHLSDLDIFFSESSRVLNNTGKLIISTNNLSSWHNIVSLLFGWTPFDLTNSSLKLQGIGNPLALHKNDTSPKQYWTHKCIYTTKWLKEWADIYGFELILNYGAGYYPLPAWVGNIDKTHSAFITLVFNKNGF